MSGSGLVMQFQTLLRRLGTFFLFLSFSLNFYFLLMSSPISKSGCCCCFLAFSASGTSCNSLSSLLSLSLEDAAASSHKRPHLLCCIAPIYTYTVDSMVNGSLRNHWFPKVPWFFSLFFFFWKIKVILLTLIVTETGGSLFALALYPANSTPCVEDISNI